jgi:hypothetical protein
MRRNPCLDAALHEFENADICVEQSHGGKHLKLKWAVHGHIPRIYPIAATPSSRRSVHNVRADIRRLLRADGALNPKDLNTNVFFTGRRTGNQRGQFQANQKSGERNTDDAMRLAEIANPNNNETKRIRNRAARRLEILALRSLELADRVAEGSIKFIDAVDVAYEAAIWSGLVDEVGDDIVQACMAAAFANARRAV